MKVEYDFKGERKIVEIDNNESKAKIREREYILYTYLINAPESTRERYIYSTKTFFKKTNKEGLIRSDNIINPFNIRIDYIQFCKDILENIKTIESYQKIDNDIRHNATRTFLGNYLIDFVENFTMPQFWWLCISEKEQYWKEKYPFDKWQLGKNSDMIAYKYRGNVKEGDIAIFYFTDDIKAIRYIGRVYKIDEYIHFDMLLKIEKGFDLQKIRNIDGLENYPPQGGFSKMGNQQIALELVIKCFENGQLQQNMVANQNSEKQENEPIINTDSIKGKNMKTIPPLNQILYGPPGTGKTYSTIDKALEILGYAESDNSGKVILDYTKIKQKLQNIADDKNGAGLDLKNLNSKNDRELAKLLFDYYRSAEQGQIKFVTFHQSFSYEEFVEGIKPKFVKKSKKFSNETETKSKEMIYKVKSGIFKKICKKALKNCDSSNKITLQKIQERIKSNPCVWKVSLGGKTSGEALLVQEYCFKHNEIEIRIAHLDKGDGDRVVKPFKDTMQKGDFVGVFSKKSILKAIGIIVGDYEKKEVIGDSFQKIAPFKRTRNVKWLLKNEDIDSGKDLSRPQDAVFDSGIKAKDLFEKIQDRVGYTFDDLPNQITCKDLPKKPYVLIIDEINRGNISKILGELITLIEPSKRIGSEEELRVTLPYSGNEFDNGKGFGVPNNLYIIGTMNTADRSIALLDTALRRRFEFIEMMPECEHKDISTNCEGVNLQELLKTMNERIEFLLDREHTIGHSFFVGVDSLDRLCEVFKLKIIPLLQEYFYDDYAKIQAVLNDNEMIKAFSKQDLKVNLNDDFVDNDKTVYRITDSNMWKKENFQRIYDSGVKIDTDE